MIVQSTSKSVFNTVLKILIIDDDEDDYIIARDMLKEAKGRKFEISWASTYLAGRTELSSNYYNAVLVDYDLGIHSGIELIREANEKGYPAPLILFTGRGNFEVDVEAMQAGATLYLTKGEANSLLLERAVRYAIEMKQKEQAIRLSEEKFAKAFATNPAAIVLTRLIDGQIIEVNDTWQSMFGYSREEAIGSYISLKLWPSPEGRVRFIQKLREEGSFQGWEQMLLRRSGEPFLSLGSAAILNVAGEELVQSTWLDISGRKNAEKALRESRERLERAQEIAHLGSWELDLIHNKLAWSDEVYRIFGLQPKEFSATYEAFLDHIHPDDRAAVDAAYTSSLLENRDEYEIEHRVIRKSTGEIRIVHEKCEHFRDETGRIIRSVGMVHDITERRRAEEIQRENEQKFRSLFEYSTDAVFLTNTDGVIEAANPAACVMFGRSEEELCRLGRSGLLDTEDPRLAAELENRQQKGQIKGAELTAIRKSGERFPVEVDSVILPSEPARSFVIMREITERKRAEAALRESEERYRLAVLPTNNAIWDWDLSTNMVEWNEALTEVFGYDSSDQLYSSADWWRTHIHPDDQVRILNSIYEVINGDGEAWTGGYRFQRADGSYAEIHDRGWVVRDEDGRPVRMVGAMEDVTYQKEAERELRRQSDALRLSEARLQELADAMPHVVWTAKPDGTVDYLNRRYREYDGFIWTENEGWSWINSVHPDDRKLVIDTWVLALQTVEAHQSEVRTRMADGSYRWHLARIVPIKDPEGKVTRWIGTNTDIEDQKQTEDRLRRSNQELEEFAFVASHDLQEPIRKIRGFVKLIQQKQKGKLDEETQDSFERMINASERMHAMIEDLLELSRVNTQGSSFVPVDLSEMAADVVSDLEARIQQTGGQVLIEALPRIEADPVQIHLVFQNLIGNGLKFHKPDSPPLVKVTGSTIQSKEGRKVVIRVEDNGIGFDEQEFEKILLPFHRLHGRNEYEGTGIGLAIVKKIIERHHGEIAAHSIPGEGTTFLITLPIKQLY